MFLSIGPKKSKSSMLELIVSRRENEQGAIRKWRQPGGMAGGGEKVDVTISVGGA